MAGFARNFNDETVRESGFGATGEFRKRRPNHTPVLQDQPIMLDKHTECGGNPVITQAIG